MTLESVSCMLPLPTCAAKIFEALEIPTKVGTYNTTTNGTEIILKIRINLDLFSKFRCFDFHKTGFDSFHERLLITECNTPTSNWVFEFVSVYASIDHTSKKVIHYMC